MTVLKLHVCDHLLLMLFLLQLQSLKIAVYDLQLFWRVSIVSLKFIDLVWKRGFSIVTHSVQIHIIELVTKWIIFWSRILNLGFFLWKFVLDFRIWNVDLTEILKRLINEKADWGVNHSIRLNFLEIEFLTWFFLFYYWDFL